MLSGLAAQGFVRTAREGGLAHLLVGDRWRLSSVIPTLVGCQEVSDSRVLTKALGATQGLFRGQAAGAGGQESGEGREDRGQGGRRKCRREGSRVGLQRNREDGCGGR